MVDVSRVAFEDGLFARHFGAAETALHAVKHDALRFRRRVFDAFGLGCGERWRSLADHVLAGADGRQRRGGVQVRGEADADRVQFLVRDQLLPRRVLARDLELIHHLTPARRDEVGDGRQFESA
jgi:hypothetical protein